MEGPRPKFARTDGGEGGSHPSNVHDHVYAIGTINYTGAPDHLVISDTTSGPAALHVTSMLLPLLNSSA
jgi:urea carboxylase